MTTLNLCGKWTLQDCETGKTFDAAVPGLNYLDLMANGEISDPYKAKDDKEFFYIYKRAWKYTKSFSVSDSQLSEAHAYLFFERLDTLAEVQLNGKLVAKTKNIHRTYRYDVKDLLVPGENTLTVTFASISDYIDEKQKKNRLPSNFNGTEGHPHIRKCACQFGWDFAAEFDMQGIGGKVELKFTSEPEISAFTVYQKLRGNTATVNVKLAVSDFSQGCTWNLTLTEPSGNKQKIKLNAENTNEASFEIEEPELWWSLGLGAQPLYKITAELKKDKKILGKKEKKIGLRTIELNRTDGDFQFIINGVPIFAKGANYVPMDLFYTRVDRDRLYSLLSKAKEANMNMIRVWGGGFYESDDFYDICDEMGILLWQDCAFACCAYPFMDDDFLEECKAEVLENVERIFHHASLALWCGNNEIESMSMAWINRISFISTTEKFFYDTLPALIRQIDTVTPYHACSPSSGKYMKLVNSDKVGDTHIWNVWHGYQSKNYFKKRTTKFCSEFGMQSYPTKGVAIHQKCDLGEERLAYYMAKHFTLSKSDDEKAYLTQLLQLEAMKEGVEHFRRNMHRCHGALIWQLNDCWDVVSWAMLDYPLGKKAVMYAAKRFNEHVHVSASSKRGLADVYVSNDLNTKFSGKLVVSCAPVNKEEHVILERDICVDAVSAEKIVSVRSGNKKRNVLVLRVYDENEACVSENRFLFCDNNRLKLIDPKLSVKVNEDEPSVSVSAENYARYVFLEADDMEFGSNFFDLSAGETKNVEFEGNAQDANVKATSLYSPLSHRSIIEDTKALLKNALMPMAIANRVSRWFDK